MDFGLGSWCSFLLWGLMGRSCTRFAFVLWGCYFWQIFLSGVGKTSCFYVNYVGIVGFIINWWTLLVLPLIVVEAWADAE